MLQAAYTKCNSVYPVYVRVLDLVFYVFSQSVELELHDVMHPWKVNGTVAAQEALGAWSIVVVRLPTAAGLRIVCWIHA